MDKFSLETQYKIYDDNEGVSLTVKPFPDAPNSAVAITTDDEKSKKWFGDLYMSLYPEQAKLLGQALIKLAETYDR